MDTNTFSCNLFKNIKSRRHTFVTTWEDPLLSVEIKQISQKKYL